MSAKAHGTFSRYLDGCLCNVCFRAARNVHKVRSLQLKKKPLEPGYKLPKYFDKHGTRACYVRGCPCQLCKDAENAYQRAWKANKRAKENA